MTYHTPDDVAAKLNVKRPYVLRKAREGSWPHARFGRWVRFTDQHVAAIEALHEVQPTPVEAVAESWGRVTK